MLNISICDDFPVFCEQMEASIRQYGEKNNNTFNIWRFGSGEELIDLLCKEDVSFDLVFLDYLMKKLTGLETAKRIRQLELSKSRPACNIVFVTSMDNIYELMSVDPLRIIRKPANQETIDEILACVWNEKHKSTAVSSGPGRQQGGFSSKTGR